MTPEREPGLSRRVFLRRGLFGSLLLGLGGLGWLATRAGKTLPLPPEGLEALTAREYAVVHALSARLGPPASGPGAAAQVADTALRADRALHLADPSAQREVKQLLGALESAAVGFLFHGLHAPFTALTPEQQDRVLEGWRHSALSVKRTGYQALRTLVLAACYASPARWAAIGYSGPPAGFARPGKNAPP